MNNNDGRSGHHGAGEETGALVSRFLAWEEHLEAYRFAGSLIGIDGNATPPPEGAAYRGGKRAILEEDAFRLKTDPEMQEVMTALSQAPDLSPQLRRRVALRLRETAPLMSTPPELYRSFTQIRSASETAWQSLRATGDYARYAPYLRDLIAVQRELLTCRRGTPGREYDILLDDHQEGWNTGRYDAFFSALKERLLPLLARIRSSGVTIDRSFLSGPFPVSKQRAAMAGLTEYLGFTSGWGRLGESLHPLTTWICRGDVRLTTRYNVQDVSDAFFSTVHETGHAWYIHNVDPSCDGTVLLTGISAGIQESQSRLCENLLGRREAFWEANLPSLQRLFPESLGGITPAQFTRAVNAVHPAPVRTSADEVTYPLHILIRYEMEKLIFSGDCAAEHLDRLWNDLYFRYLDVRVPDGTAGILQDMHWPYAYFGYFPTYALGNAFAAQFFRAMEQQLDVDALLRSGRYPEIMGWLREHVHRWGALYSADELILRVTGAPFSPDPYLDYLEEKYSALYRL